MPKLTKRLVDAFQTDKPEAYLWDNLIQGFGVRARKSGRKSFIVKYRLGSSARRHTLGKVNELMTIGEARDAAATILRQVRDGRDPTVERKARNAAITVNELIAIYLVEGRFAKPNKRESSWRSDASAFRAHVKPLIGHRLARDITRRDLEKLQADVVAGKTARNVKTGKRGRAISRGGPGAAGMMIRSTAAMFAWAVRQELVLSNPSVGMQKVSARPRERFLSLQEAQRLFETLDAMVSARQINASQAAIIRLLLFTGARKSEIVRLSWLEVDLERRRIVLPWHRSKTGQRTILLNTAAHDEFMKLERIDRYVFPGRGGVGPMDFNHSDWDRIRKTAGLDGLRIHDLRHSFASFAAADGVSLYVIGKALGHRQASTTERYAHLTDDPVLAAVELVGARFNRPS